MIYSEEQLMARLKFFIGICLAMTLTGIVFVVLYSLIFVTQPLNAISPIDQKFFELIIPIATFLTGTLSGIMLASPGDKEASKQALTAANAGWGKPPSPTPTNGGLSNGGFDSSPSTPQAGFGASPGSFGSSASTGFGSSSAFGAPTSGPVNAGPSWGTTPVSSTPAVVAGFGGKPAPAPAFQPEL